MSRQLKAADVYRAANYTRDQLRGLLSELGYEIENGGAARQRVARSYSPQDLLVILVACELDSEFGLKRKVIASLMPAISRELSGIRLAKFGAKLVLTTNPPSAEYLDDDVAVDQGIILPLSSVFARVEQQLRAVGVGWQPLQSELNFGPTLVSNTPLASLTNSPPARRVRQ
jgi:hypothetical protein